MRSREICHHAFHTLCFWTLCTQASRFLVQALRRVPLPYVDCRRVCMVFSETWSRDSNWICNVPAPPQPFPRSLGAPLICCGRWRGPYSHSARFRPRIFLLLFLPFLFDMRVFYICAFVYASNCGFVLWRLMPSLLFRVSGGTSFGRRWNVPFWERSVEQHGVPGVIDIYVNYIVRLLGVRAVL